MRFYFTCMLMFLLQQMVFAEDDSRLDVLTTSGVMVTLEDGNYPWEVSDKDGVVGLMSGNRGVQSSTSTLTIKLNSTEEFLLKFDYMVSSERSYDKYTVKVGDETVANEISGLMNDTYAKILPAGEHKISVTYTKDGSRDDNDDRAYIYNFKATTSPSEEDYPFITAVVYTVTTDANETTNTAEQGTLTFCKKRYNELINETYFGLNKGNDTPSWSSKAENITKVVFDESFADVRPTTCNKWFKYCSNLTTIENIKYLNTSAVTNMYGMFYGCSSLITLDLTGFDTKYVNYISEMFYNCSNLKTIYASDRFVVSNFYYGADIFSGCTTLVGAISYDPNKITTDYANYKTGYFKSYVEINNQKYEIYGEHNTVPVEITLNDGDDLQFSCSFIASKLIYKRIFSNGNWKPLYIPFDLSYDDWSAQGVEIASPNNFHEYEQEDGTYKVTLEVKKVLEGKLTPNYPYVIRLKDATSPGEVKTIEINNVEVKLLASNSIDCKSFTRKYKFTGIYEPKSEFQDDSEATDYVVGADKIAKPEDGSVLKGQRWYLSISNLEPFYNPYETAGASLRSIEIDGDGDTTGIEVVETEADKDSSKYDVYDLQGRKLNTQPKKGMYIRNGKKYVVK